MKKRTTVLIVLSTLCIGLLVGFWMPRDDTYFAIRKNFTIFGSVYEEITTAYVEPVDPGRLMRTGIEAMLGTLDPYTVFISEAENEDIDIMTEGSYGGVGLSIGVIHGKITIISPIEGYSGDTQGVRTGDVVTHIDSIPAENLSMLDVRNMLRGEPGTTVSLRVHRVGEPQPLQFTLTRAQVELENVTYAGFINHDPSTGIGYIRLERFAREAPQEMRRAIESLMNTGELEGLVLDLRGNPGGLLEAAVEICDLFLPEGKVIVSTRGRNGRNERVYRSQSRPLVPNDIPLVVLVNGASASASEIVAGAVQDLDRGVIMGERTFGKGLVQVIKSLPYNTSLKITVSKYYTPSGRSIQDINYKHDDANGGAVAIADSLRKVFRTENGRRVRGGGGIEPDVVIHDTDYSPLVASLRRQSAFFLYANQYAAVHDSVSMPFTVSNTTVQAFRAWLEQEQFSYNTPAERTLASLTGQLRAVNYSEAMDELQELRQAVAAEKAGAINRYTKQVKEQLRTQILSRYKSQTEQIRASLATDKQVRKAVSLLQDSTAYHALLTP